MAALNCTGLLDSSEIRGVYQKNSETSKVEKDASSTTVTSITSHYQKPLPSLAISLYADEGKRLFDEARTLGTAAGFLEIATNLVTQKELTYCGLSSLITILNALHIDPLLVWKGSYRWYDESMLIKKETNQGFPFEDLTELVPTDKVKLQACYASESSLEQFRQRLLETCSSSSSYILTNFSRTELGQEGGGHHSPIAAYNSLHDVALILDVARFKYPPHWVPVTALWKSMAAETDAPSRKTRGFMVISKP